MNKMTPQIRFQGFTDDWEERKLSDVANHRGGTAIEKYFDKDGVYKVISIGSYGLNSQYVDQNIRAISNEITDGRVVNSGELTMVLNDKTANGTIIGRTLLVEKDNEYVINQRTEIISPKENFDSNFAYTILNGPFREKVKRIVQGGTQIYVNYPAVSNLNLELPKIEEQKKIGSFFKQLDDTIALHQRKLDLLKEQKKGYLQKMFPKNGAKVPELRFAGFDDDWEERKLGEFSDVRDGTHASPKYVSQGHPMVTSKNLTHSGLDMTDVSFLTDEDFNEINKRSKVSIGDILFGMIGTIGNPVIVDRDDFAIKNVALIKEKTSTPITNKWLLQYLKSPSFNRFIQKENAGGTQKFIALGLIRDMKLRVPELDEQQKIGSFFKQLDNTIALHQRKLDLLKEQKKGFLQKMFVS